MSKVTVELHEDLTAKCDVCGKDRHCVQLYRNAKRHERENFSVEICQSCAELILSQFNYRKETA